MKNLTVVGIDPDTHKLSLVETGPDRRAKPWMHTIPLPSTEHYRRCEFAFRGMSEFLYNIKERDGVQPVVYLEEPIMGVGGPGATIPQVYVQGAVMAACSEWETKVHQINNSTWKKRICGNGNIAKADIPGVMKDVWPELYLAAKDQQDLIDAGAIHLYGVWHQDLMNKIRKHRGQ